MTDDSPPKPFDSSLHAAEALHGLAIAETGPEAVSRADYQAAHASLMRRSRRCFRYRRRLAAEPNPGRPVDVPPRNGVGTGLVGDPTGRVADLIWGRAYERRDSDP